MSKKDIMVRVAMAQMAAGDPRNRQLLDDVGWEIKNLRAENERLLTKAIIDRDMWDEDVLAIQTLEAENKRLRDILSDPEIMSRGSLDRARESLENGEEKP